MRRQFESAAYAALAAAVPSQAIAPLRQRLLALRDERSRAPVSVQPQMDHAIQETEALIKRLENPNVPRTA